MSALWDHLFNTVSLYDSDAASRLTLIREDSATSKTFGPSIGSLLDKHGQCIRSAGTKEDIEGKAATCACARIFPDFFDPSVGHVRTSNTSILPLGLAKYGKLGLNFRPKFSVTKHEIKEHIYHWAVSVLKKLRHKVIKDNVDEILKVFMDSSNNRSVKIKALKGMSHELLASLSAKCNEHLVITCTDKVPHSASIECLHWYRLACLKRLESDAFEACTFPDMLHIPDILEFTPWESSSIFKPAILFGMAKQHKRVKDPLAYRWITSACSDKSKPLSDELLRLLTFLWNKAEDDCKLLGETSGAKFFWAIDSLDIVPFNTEIDLCRVNRQPSAFDLEKCFESIPLSDSEHSLMSRVSFFLDLVWMKNNNLNSKSHPFLPGPSRECEWNNKEADYSYDKQSILNLLKAVTDSAILTVGLNAAKQTQGIPMGFSSSVILLNIYMFTYEFEFTQRLADRAPELLHHTREIYRYVDDLSNFSDLDLRPFLGEMSQRPRIRNWKWIYPMAPWGPLSMTDQTVRAKRFTEVIFLNMRFTLKKGFLSYCWYDKASTYKGMGFPISCYTHWGSSVTFACKIGIIRSQVRSIIIASSSFESCMDSLGQLLLKLESINCPSELANKTVTIALKSFLPTLPVPFSSSWSTKA